MSNTDNADKGRLVEQIAAMLHETPDVTLESNARIPSLQGNGSREIDVLISCEVAGYSVRLAIECKNEKDPIGVERIDAFIGKLKDVGIPVQQGIYISASGYTAGAIRRARVEGIRP